jgi:CheY-like chemotaxis protein
MDKFERVMCVEDDPDIRMILEFSLGRLGGYTLNVCASGQAALDQALQFAPQLVLLDVMMPEMSGPETLKHLRAMDAMRGVPIVFLTAKAMQDEVEALLEHGATGIIVKPFDPVTLPQDIRIYWEHGRGIQP